MAGLTVYRILTKIFIFFTSQEINKFRFLYIYVYIYNMCKFIHIHYTYIYMTISVYKYIIDYLVRMNLECTVLKELYTSETTLAQKIVLTPLNNKFKLKI